MSARLKGSAIAGVDEIDCLDCSLCDEGQPKMMITREGPSAGFLVKFQCGGCGQASAGTLALPYTAAVRAREIERWNSEQEHSLFDAAAVEAPRKRSMRM